MSLLDTASLVITPNGTKAGKLYSVVPSDGSGDMTVTRATSATRVNSAGLIESVASNVPRLDYSNGCPSILVEPQRTNLAFYSEQFDNAYWTSFESSISANAIISPNGATTADKIIDTTVNNIHANFKGFIISAESTLSYFVKIAEYSRVAIGNFSDGGEAVFNLSTGAVVSTSSNWKNSSITALANGWFKISATTNGVSGAKAIGVQLVNNSGALSFAGTGASGLYLWGAQLEAGSYATSYIPTTSASVTRNADVISKTGISSLIGQTEGTIYWEGQVNGFGQYPQLFDLNANGNKFIQIFNSVVSGIPRIGIYVQNVGVLLIDGNIATISYDTNFKFALGYKANDYVVYLNGNQVYTNTTIGVPPTSNFGLGDSEQGGSTSKKNVKASALWKTRLTNTQLAQLTTI